MFMGTPRAGVWEVKNWLSIYNSSQIQAEANLASALGVPYYIIVRKHTHVPGSVFDTVSRTGGQIYRLTKGEFAEVATR